MPLAGNLVNRLLTISIKVNIRAICRISMTAGDGKMKKTKASRGFLNWLLGGGWCGGGGGG
jgi:hypothetical protein